MTVYGPCHKFPPNPTTVREMAFSNHDEGVALAHFLNQLPAGHQTKPAERQARSTSLFLACFALPEKATRGSPPPPPPAEETHQPQPLGRSTPRGGGGGGW